MELGGWENGDVFYPLEKLTGVICTEDGKVVERASLSKLQKQGKDYGFQPDGSFQVGGKTWHLRMVLNKDKNRFVGSVDGYFVLEKPNYVSYKELEDVDF